MKCFHCGRVIEGIFGFTYISLDKPYVNLPICRNGCLQEIQNYEVTGILGSVTEEVNHSMFKYLQDNMEKIGEYIKSNEAVTTKKGVK